MDRLNELIRLGPDPRYTMKSVVLGRHEDILKARQLMRTWSDIAAALGFEGRGKDLAGCFSRVDKGVKSGKLKVPVAGSGIRPAHDNSSRTNGETSSADTERPSRIRRVGPQ